MCTQAAVQWTDRVVQAGGVDAVSPAELLEKRVRLFDQCDLLLPRAGGEVSAGSQCDELEEALSALLTLRKRHALLEAAAAAPASRPASSMLGAMGLEAGDTFALVRCGDSAGRLNSAWDVHLRPAAPPTRGAATEASRRSSAPLTWRPGGD